MSERMRRWALALAVGLGLAQTAQAQQTSDSLTVTITPNAYYAVAVDTTATSLNLGSIALGAVTGTVLPATVTVNSTYAQTDLTLIGFATTTLGIPWTFDLDATSTETDKIAAWAVFTDTSIVATPSWGVNGAFSGSIPGASNSDVVSDQSAQDVGDGGGFTGRYVLSSGSSGYKTMEDIPSSAADLAGSRSKLWFRFRLPAATTSNTAQRLTFTITAGAPN